MAASCREGDVVVVYMVDNIQSGGKCIVWRVVEYDGAMVEEW